MCFTWSRMHLWQKVRNFTSFSFLLNVFGACKMRRLKQTWKEDNFSTGKRSAAFLCTKCFYKKCASKRFQSPPKVKRKKIVISTDVATIWIFSFSSHSECFMNRYSLQYFVYLREVVTDSRWKIWKLNWAWSYCYQRCFLLRTKTSSFNFISVLRYNFEKFLKFYWNTRKVWKEEKFM